MCGTCGCGQPEKPQQRIIELEKDLLDENNHYAHENRQYFQEHNILAINFVSSPGAGKTTLLVKTIEALKNHFSIAVIEGDQQTDLDAQQIAATGAKVKQINTGKSCHLDAHQIGHAIKDLVLEKNSILFIENVGNLICPAMFDLGETQRVALLSVTEGDNKPLKYPDMFHSADLMIINKTDLLPHVDFNIVECSDYAKRINPSIQLMTISATKSDGMDDWLGWLSRAR